MSNPCKSESITERKKESQGAVYSLLTPGHSSVTAQMFIKRDVRDRVAQRRNWIGYDRGFRFLYPQSSLKPFLATFYGDHVSEDDGGVFSASYKVELSVMQISHSATSACIFSSILWKVTPPLFLHMKGSSQPGALTPWSWLLKELTRVWVTAHSLLPPSVLLQHVKTHATWEFSVWENKTVWIMLSTWYCDIVILTC